MPADIVLGAPFDLNGPGISKYLFGLPCSEEQAEAIIIPVPWEATVSSGSGTERGPEAIRTASLQVDLFVPRIRNAWKLGIYMLPFSEEWIKEARRMRQLAENHIKLLETPHIENTESLSEINAACERMVSYVQDTADHYLKKGKIVGVLGGDHSTALGFLQSTSKAYDKFGILQIDAHADLRKTYEGFTYSHASIMYNALQLPTLTRLVQVGLRDYCQEEHEMIEAAGDRIVVFRDEDIKKAQYKGDTWYSLCDSIISTLPKNVYISFDIDGLDPKLCPHTGTPVPGGMEFHQAAILIEQLVLSGRKIVGFDLSEVAPGKTNDWDANVGARILYLLCNWAAVSQERLEYV